MPNKKPAKKPVTTPLPTPAYDSGRETRVLLEEVNKNVKIVAEQHGSIVTKLEEHDNRFERMESELGTVKSELGSVKHAVLDTSRRVNKLESKLDTVITDHEKRIENLESV